MHPHWAPSGPYVVQAYCSRGLPRALPVTYNWVLAPQASKQAGLCWELGLCRREGSDSPICSTCSFILSDNKQSLVILDICIHPGLCSCVCRKEIDLAGLSYFNLYICKSIYLTEATREQDRLKQQTVVSLLMWVLWTKLSFSVRAVCVLNCWVTAPLKVFLIQRAQHSD